MKASATSSGRPFGRPPLLATKLFIPPARPGMIPRAHLLARLDDCLAYPLTLVSAPAGFGKTTLLGAWARRVACPVAWLSLEEADNDPARFLMYLVAALQRFDPAIGRDVPATLEDARPGYASAAVDALINDLLVLPAPGVLVLDDFQVISAEPVHEALRALVSHAPAQLRLILATREDPPLPLPRLRARAQLLELRAQDLRFTAEEVASFLQEVMGLALAPDAVEALDARIEGWAAGLQLAALSLRHHADPADLIAGLSGSHHFILSYLTDEVLSRLLPDLQTFLLETSVLERLTGPLCDAVTGRADSAALLEALYSANAFVIALDDEHVWFRYHHLFADLLRSQLGRTQPERAPALHARASEWYELHDEGATEAVEHAFAAGDYERVARLLETYARPVLLQGYARTVEQWLRRLPPELRLARPKANLAFAWMLLLRGRLADVEPYLRDAEAAAEGAHGAAGIRAETRALRAGLLAIRGEADRGCELAREAVALAPHDDAYVQSMTHFSLATACNYAGRTVDAIQAYQEALPLCRAAENTLASMLVVGNLALLHVARGHLRAAADLSLGVIREHEEVGAARLPALATLYGIYGHVLYQWGDLDGARRQLEQWLDLSRHGGHVAAAAYGGVLLALVEQARGDLAAADAALEQVLPLLRYDLPGWAAAQVVAQQVVLALARGDVPAAEQALARSGVGVADGTDHIREVIHLAHLRLLLHLGRRAPEAAHLERGLDLARRVLASAEPAGRMGRVMEALVLRALILDARGDAGPAMEDLERALALAEPEGYVRLFVNEGAPMATLLRAEHPASARPAYVARLLSAFPAKLATAPPGRPDLVEPLSDRELEVLRLLAEDLPYRAIAERLVVSLNTVRSHVKSIYGKLGVDKRAAAVSRARALGLL